MNLPSLRAAARRGKSNWFLPPAGSLVGENTIGFCSKKGLGFKTRFAMAFSLSPSF